jgi:hypothetical protein
VLAFCLLRLRLAASELLAIFQYCCVFFFASLVLSTAQSGAENIKVL